MKKSIYDNIVYASKKLLDKDVKVRDNTDMNKESDDKDIEGEAVDNHIFTPKVKAYVHYYNAELKKYEMFTIQVDPVSNECQLNRKVLDFDNEGRAIMEMQKLYATDHITRMKEKK